MATSVFDGIRVFQEILKRTMAGTFLRNFIKIRLVVSEKKMFKEKVNARTHGQTHGRTHDSQQAMTLSRWPKAIGAKNETFSKFII